MTSIWLLSTQEAQQMECHELEVSVIYRVNKLVFGGLFVCFVGSIHVAQRGFELSV